MCKRVLWKVEIGLLKILIGAYLGFDNITKKEI